MDLSGMLSGLTGNNGGGANPPPVNPSASASATNKPRAGGSSTPIPIPGDKYNDAPKIDASAEKIGTDAERVRAKQTNELIRINTNMLNVLRNMHEYNKEVLRSQNMANKIASIESSGGGDAISTSSRSITGGIGSSLLLGAAAGMLFPTILGLGKAFEGLANYIGSIFGTSGVSLGEQAAGGLATGAGAAKGFLNKFMGRTPTGPEAAPKTRIREGFTQEGNRYRNTETGRIASSADAVEEVRPGAVQRVTQSVVKGVRGATLSFLKKVLAFAAKYGRLLAVLVYLIEPVVLLIESGGEITQEVKKSLAKAFIGLLLNEAAAAAIGALLGSIVPGPGTIIGGVLGFGGSFALGMLAGAIIEVIANELASAFVGEKGWGEAANTISTVVKDASVKAVSDAAAAVSSTGASYAGSTYDTINSSVGGGVTGAVLGGFGAVQAYGVGAAVDAGSYIASSVSGMFSDNKDATPVSAPSAGGGRDDRASSSSSGGSAVEAKMTPGQKGNAQSAMAYLMSKGGFTKEQAAGIVGNLMGESQLDPNSKGDKNSRGEYEANGIAQWHADRWNPFLEWAKKNGKNPYTVEAQLDWVIIELGSTEKRAGNLLRKTRTAQEATDVIMNSYERPAQSLRAGESVRRGGLAMAALSTSGNGTEATNVGVASAGGASAQPPKVDTAAKISPSSGGRDDRAGGTALASAGGAAGAAGAQAMSMPSNQSIPSPTASKGGVDLLWYFGAAA